MAHSINGSVTGQVQLALQELEKSEGLPFKELLSKELVAEVVASFELVVRERIYPPAVTLWALLSQVTAGKNATCDKAVSRVLFDRVQQGKYACSADTSSYCTARDRLPEEVVSQLTRRTGRDLDKKAPTEWLWHGRPVKIADGSTFTMADTPENQKEYPQSKNQKAGLGFPIARIVIVLSLTVGTVLECAIGACRGKKTGEQTLFRTLMEDAFEAGDIALADCLYDCFRDIATLKMRGVDVVFGKKQSRNVDFRTGKRLGPGDHVVVWEKPKYDKNRFDSKEQWEKLPARIEIREVRITVRRKGHRSRTVTIVTTLLDHKQYSAKDLTDLFGMRWHCELDLRSIKRTLGMHHVPCKSPEMVRKEVWARLLAYNLIRVRMAQAAALHGVRPRTLSFASATNLIEEFAQALRHARGSELARLESELLKAIAQCRVGNRPGRKEPRAVKKRDQKHPLLTKPRDQARKGLKA